MITVPNLLSLSRLPLAFLFLFGGINYRIIAIFLALISDVLDGFIARNYRATTAVGKLIDPITDKFFVGMALATLLYEGALLPWQVAVMLSRDMAVFIFAVYLVATRQLWNYQMRAIWVGKMATSLQFIVLLLVTYGIAVPYLIYYIFISFGFLALFELFIARQLGWNVKTPPIK